VKTILATFLIVLLLLPVSAFAEIQTITHSVKQSFGGSQSPDDARIAAMSKAKREALEIAGTYIESLTVVKNSQVDKDEILALAAGVLKTEVVSQKNYVSGDAFGIEVVVKVVVDTSVLEERVKKLLQDRTHLEQLNQARKKEKELLDKVASLEEQNRHLAAENKSSKDLKKKFEETSKGLTAVAWVDKALALDKKDGKISDSKKAIEYLNEAIRLQPDYARAYAFRGVVYGDTGQHHLTTKDLDEAIHLKPDYATAYGIRGLNYFRLGKYPQAIKDYDEAIRLKPDYVMAYLGRGIAYTELGQYPQAIEDYNQAIRLKPDYVDAYSSRGGAYNRLGNHEQAISDYDQAIRLKPDYADAYYNRGLAYNSLGQHQRAIEDYTQAIRLKPDYADAYYTRGLAYGRDLGQHQSAIKDYDKAIRLKPDYTVAYSSRGRAYHNLGQYQRAIKDYDKAIRLKPDYVGAYINRAISYFLQGKNNLGCGDAQKACALGNCGLLEFSKGKGACR
jgi:tetratricopeptide (TPR) repeat protein